MAAGGAAFANLAFPIAVAAVIGACLSESGGADRIVRQAIGVLGEKMAGVAFLLTAFVLSAPVFIDTVLMLLLPLARAMRLRTGSHYLLYVLVICGAASVSNGLIPPAPGPLFVASALKLELGKALAAGAAFGVLPLIAVYPVAKFFDHRMTVPLRPVDGSDLEALQATLQAPDSTLPGFGVSILPILLPLVLIGGSSLVGVGGFRLSPALAACARFLGDKSVALSIGAGVAIGVLARQKRLGWRWVGPELRRPLEAAGMIILVISSGGAYGGMIKAAGIGQVARNLAGNHAPNFILLGWATAALMRAAQGSATVASITAISIIVSIAGAAGFGVHPIYVYLAVGFGSKFLDWMNNSGFWVICRWGGLTQGETLRTWTILVSAVSLVGLAEVLTASALFPAL
jgi:GntP family gluconate:H+ symporter